MALLLRKKRPRLVVLAPLLLVSASILCALSIFKSVQLLEGHNPVAEALYLYRRTQSKHKDAQRIVERALVIDGDLLQDPPSWPVEEALENPPMPDGNSTFSACLLLMDDNHRLHEWLAYHYHVLPLRYILITVDPRSQTSPSSIFNEWRKKGMYIEEWTDQDFWKEGKNLRPIPDDAELQMKRDRHRGRQKYFYKECMVHLKANNRTWVALNDSDEYIVYNHKGGEAFAKWQEERTRRFLKNPRNTIKKLLIPKQAPPTTAKQGGMIEYIRQEQAAGVEYYQSPCIGIPRTTFGAAESDVEQLNKYIPKELVDQQRVEPMQLDTIRFRKHAGRNDFTKNALGKVIMDVSRIDVRGSPKFTSLHRPIKKICSTPWHNDWDVGLRINHYLGSWESYTIRDDCRRGGERSWEQWEYKATTNGEFEDDIIQPWISGFVQAEGNDEAARLLQKAGLPKGYKNTNIDAWKLHPDKLKAILAVPETASNDGKLVAFERWVRRKYVNNIQKIETE